MSQVIQLKTAIEAEQYLEDHTNWNSLHSLISVEDYAEEHDSMGQRVLVITYDLRDFVLSFGDWVVKYPDGSLHFFAKDTFDELFHNPFADELSEKEMVGLLSGVRS